MKERVGPATGRQKVGQVRTEAHGRLVWVGLCKITVSVEVWGQLPALSLLERPPGGWAF